MHQICSHSVLEQLKSICITESTWNNHYRIYCSNIFYTTEMTRSVTSLINGLEFQQNMTKQSLIWNSTTRLNRVEDVQYIRYQSNGGFSHTWLHRLAKVWRKWSLFLNRKSEEWCVETERVLRASQQIFFVGFDGTVRHQPARCEKSLPETNRRTSNRTSDDISFCLLLIPALQKRSTYSL